MVFKKFDFTKDIFMLSPQLHKRSWDYYFRQYSNASRLFVQLASKCDNITNPIFMPVMFVFRHCLELLLKRGVFKQGKTIPNNHELSSIAANLGYDISSWEAFYPNSDGGCYRYTTNNYGEYYQLPGGPFCTFESIESFIALHNDLLEEDEIAINIPKINKFVINEFAFYPRECNSLGAIAAQYDIAISEFLDAISQSTIDSNDCYLPLLFLIRHSLELKIKNSVYNIGGRVPIQIQNGLCREHSVAKLYQILTTYIDIAIDKIVNNASFKNESMEYQHKALLQVEQIKNIDANSLAFRFPFTSKGNLQTFVPQKSTLQNAIQLHQDADTFLTFGVEVLAESGYLELGDDILHKLFD